MTDDRETARVTDAQALRFDNTVILITGAGRGLGRAYAKLLGARGAKIAINNRSAKNAHEAVREVEQLGGTAVPIVEDISDPAAARACVARTMEAFGHLDVLINNAGGVDKMESFAEIVEPERDEIFRRNFFSTWDVTAAAWPHFIAQQSGRIVMTTSPTALFGANTHAHYSAAKAALIGLTKSLAVEGAESGIRVNAIAPIGYTSAAEKWTQDRAMLAYLENTFPADLVAAAVAWLVHESCPLSGETLCVAGPRIVRDFIGETAGYVTIPAAFRPETIGGHLESIMDTHVFRVHRDTNAFLQHVNTSFGLTSPTDH